MRFLVYGDSNSWGFPPDGSGVRFDTQTRWPTVMAAALGVEVIEECLPGRTTCYDDPEMFGETMNGQRHLAAAIKSHSPLDALVIMLGTNDLKARFDPDANKIAGNIAELVACAKAAGGGPGPWDSERSPEVFVIIPPQLGEAVDSHAWDRSSEWAGGRVASLALANAVAALEPALLTPVFEAGSIVTGAESDPIHLDADNQRRLGHGIADWLRGQLALE